MKTLVLLAAALLTVLSFAMTPQAAQAARGDRQIIDLWGSYAYPEVDGKAKYRVDGPDRREFEVEVEDALHLLYRTLDIYVDGAWVGSMRVRPKLNLAGYIVDGVAELKLSTRSRYRVPLISARSLVEVKYRAVLVASGTF